MSSSGLTRVPCSGSDPRLSIDLGFSPEVLFGPLFCMSLCPGIVKYSTQAFCSSCVFEDERVLTGWTQDTSCQTYKKNVWVPVLT